MNVKKQAYKKQKRGYNMLIIKEGRLKIHKKPKRTNAQYGS